jgi:arabinan endo-1,5-alpha-L-arabinosidase
VKFKIGVRG